MSIEFAENTYLIVVMLSNTNHFLSSATLNLAITFQICMLIISFYYSKYYEVFKNIYCAVRSVTIIVL